ncbi:hypothetical protein NDU88_004877 [Pleurodeles waltl]|uniref:Uncharacterized protein n=1 Tax=Pleurodeles waltl TaxID=8319 RepID=A0AAV7QDR3_PLEWA|nr:hypothetical protein NDU88_004877 [Pleurodeles waltl]
MEGLGAAVGLVDRTAALAGLPRGSWVRGAAAGMETRAVHTCAAELSGLGAAGEQWREVRSPRLQLERRWWPEPGRLPRPIVAKLLHYRDCNLLLQTAREKGPFQVVGSRATFFPDFTLAVQARRATSLEVKWALREEGLRYSLLFPSKLKIILDGARHSFQEPDEVWT